jgi:quercetin dioxygenase-like cupin family protein
MMSANARAWSVGSLDELASEAPYPGLSRRTFHAEHVTINYYVFQPGASFPLHSHEQQQVTIISAGDVRMKIQGEVVRLERGGWTVVPGGIEHGITAGPEGAALMAIIAPRREAAGDYELAEGAS